MVHKGLDIIELSRLVVAMNGTLYYFHWAFDLPPLIFKFYGMQTPIPVAERKIQNKKLKPDQNSVSYLFF